MQSFGGGYYKSDKPPQGALQPISQNATTQNITAYVPPSVGNSLEQNNMQSIQPNDAVVNGVRNSLQTNDGQVHTLTAPSIAPGARGSRHNVNGKSGEASTGIRIAIGGQNTKSEAVARQDQQA